MLGLGPACATLYTGRCVGSKYLHRVTPRCPRSHLLILTSRSVCAISLLIPEQDVPVLTRLVQLALRTLAH